MSDQQVFNCLNTYIPLTSDHSVDKKKLLIFESIINSNRVDPNILLTKCPNGQTILHLLTADLTGLSIRVFLNSMHFVKDHLFAIDTNGRTPFHIACVLSVDSTKYLLDSKYCTKDIVSIQDVIKNTCLHVACMDTKIGCDGLLSTKWNIKCIIESKHCSKNMVEMQNLNGNTALHLCAKFCPDYLPHILNSEYITIYCLNIQNQNYKTYIDILVDEKYNDLHIILDLHNNVGNKRKSEIDLEYDIKKSKH
jgi:uncharacterized protein (UPF0333 family)